MAAPKFAGFGSTKRDALKVASRDFSRPAHLCSRNTWVQWMAPRQYTLDEDIVLHALRGVDAHDQPDQSSALLVYQLGTLGHSLSCNRELERRLLTKIHIMERARTEMLVPGVLDVLRQFWVRQGGVFRGEWQGDAVPPRVPRKDVHVVESALAGACPMVSSDEELRAAVLAEPRLRDVGVIALAPREAQLHVHT